MKQLEKLQLQSDLEHYGDFESLCSILMSWAKKSDNPDLTKAIQMVNKMFFYIHDLQEWRRLSEKTYEEFRSDKLRAVERARRAEKELKELQAEINKLKQISNL